MNEEKKPLKTDALLLPETKTREEGMLIDKGDEAEREMWGGVRSEAVNQEGGEKMPTVIIPMEPIGAPETSTVPISVPALEEMVKAGEPAAQKLVESKYCFEYEISGRVFPYAFDPEKRTLKICRGATADGIPIGDIQILHKSVSREKHATIGYNGSECVLKDVGSRNGTYVLDHQPEPGEKPKWNKIEKPYGLRNGEVLKFGDAVLTYREKKK